MKHNQIIPGAGAMLGMLILILDGKTALEGAQNGVELCLKTVIPSLFPFFVLSILLTNSFSGISLPILKQLRRICRIPAGAESILISGFLGGYPAGAQCVAEAYRSGNLDKEDAQRMLTFCNNAGPAFLFGMVSSLFPYKWMIWLLWGIHIFSAILVCVTIPGSNHRQVHIENHSKPLSEVLHSAIRVTASVCGWIILFRILITFLERWLLWIFPSDLQVVFIGILELSNGCCELYHVSSLAERFIVCSGILAFGGLCVTMQTVSIISPLSPRSYLFGKLLQTVYSLSISAAIMYQTWIPLCVMFVTPLFTLMKKQKKSSNHAAVRV